MQDRIEPVKDRMAVSTWGLPRYGWLIVGLAVTTVGTIIVVEGLIRWPGRVRVGDRVRVPWMLGDGA